MKRVMVLFLVGWALMGASADDAPPDDLKAAARELLEMTRAHYRQAQTFRAEGKALTMILNPESGTETSLGAEFSIKLARPNYYRIEWKQQLGMGQTQSGAVWNDGDGPRLYLGAADSYTEMESDALALAAATGASMGTAHTIPTIFFGFTETPSLIDRLQDAELEGSQVVGGQDCHIVAGRLENNIRYRLWIATNEPYIVQVENMLGGSTEDDAIEDPTPEQEERTLKALKLEPTEENRERIRAAMIKARKVMATVRGTSKQLYSEVDLTRPIATEAFVFEVPTNAVSRSPFRLADEPEEASP